MTTQTQPGSSTIDQLIINSPYDEPREHWRYHRETRLFTREQERRRAGYVRASESSRSFDDPGIFIELPLVNQIRPRVKAWREADYPGATGISKRLLQHWRDPEQRDSNRRFFFCQLEAIETLIFLTEGPESERVGIKIPDDGGPFVRLCCKMATGSGKTILMSMLIAWQALNKVRGVIRKFRPDYLVRLASGRALVLEVKGQDNQKQQTKREFLGEWVHAMNGHGGFGIWASDVSRYPSDIHEILQRHAN